MTSPWMNGDANFHPIARRESDILSPGPSQASVLWDENEDSINNAGLWISSFGTREYGDLPASRHNYGCTMSFADGHVEYWKWKGPWIFKFKGNPTPATPKDRDLPRIQATVPSR